ncbi:MAG: hypothetical protein RR460_04290 [Clostridium sp.]
MNRDLGRGEPEELYHKGRVRQFFRFNIEQLSINYYKPLKKDRVNSSNFRLSDYKLM